MSNQGRNSSFSNVHRFGREHSRPSSLSSPMLLACRICDKIYLSAQSLIEHYQSHDSDAQQRTNFMPFQRERSNPFNHRVAPSSLFHQRPHPYLPNRYRTNSSFLAPSQNPQPLQPRNHPVTSDGNLVVSSSYPVSIRGSDTAGSTGPFVLNHPAEMPKPQLGLSLNNKYQRTAPFMRIQHRKGYDESADKRTIWYLGQLEQPIPQIIDLESQDEDRELVNLSL